MNKLDLIINALELCDPDRVGEALAAARELHEVNRELVGALVSFTKSDYIKKQHPKRYANAKAALSKATGEK